MSVEESDHEADTEAEMCLSWKVNSCDKRQYMLHNFTHVTNMIDSSSRQNAFVLKNQQLPHTS